MRIIYGDRQTGKTTAMLNWFLAPTPGAEKRVIIVPDQKQVEHIRTHLRRWAVGNRIHQVQLADHFRRLMAWNEVQRRTMGGAGVGEVWIDNFDMVLANQLRLHVPLKNFTLTSTEPFYSEHIVRPRSTMEEF